MKKKIRNLAIIFISLFFILLLFILITNSGSDDYPQITRYEKIPSTTIKQTAQTDKLSPILHTSEYEKPIQLSSTINSKGAEDSPFILPDSNTLYFFFTPDTNIPAEKQLFDDVTGIWVSNKDSDGKWNEPKRIWLQDANKLALDGCEFVEGNNMLFCSAREGYEGINWFSAEYKDNKWTNYKQVEFPAEWRVGELHEYNNTLYFHSDKVGGKGGLDIWMIERKADSTWTNPINIKNINSPEDESLPAISPNGQEMFFTRTYRGSPAIYKSLNVDGQWDTPKLIISQFAGEPTIDNKGNIYFVHHFYKDNQMIEADIYVALKK